MKAIIFPEQELIKSDFTYPEDMMTLIRFLESEKAVLNIDYMVLEKLWYAFSETMCASFLQVDKNTYADFKEWVSNISCDEADKMDYDGRIHENPYRPWED